MKPTIKRSLRRRITLIFATASLAIAASSLVLLYFVTEGPRHLGDFHVPSLFAAQQLGAHTEESMERTFAYLVSGDPDIKAEAISEFDEFKEDLRAWRELHIADPERDPRLAVIADEIEQNGRLLQARAERLFDEYEKGGRSGVSAESFESFNEIIDEMMAAIGSLVALEKEGVDDSHSDAVAVINGAALGIVAIALFSVLLATFIGRIIAGTVSSPVEKLAENARRISAGELDSPFEKTGSGEISELSESLEGMRRDLKDSFNRVRVLLEQMPTILWTTDDRMMLDTLEGAGVEALGLIGHLPLDRPVTALFEPEENALVTASHRAALGGRSATFEAHHGTRTYRNYLEPLKDSAGAIVGTIGVAIDVSESKLAAETIAHMANHDPLTDLPNRNLFQDRLTHDLGHAQRRGDGLALFFIDIDGFKHINDTLGASVGDALLRQAAHRLADCVREDDTLARIGGDEFAVIQSDIGTADDAASLAQRMIDSITDPVIDADGQMVQVTCSVGVVIAGHHTPPGIESLMARADIAMHQAKEKGPGRYQFFDAAMNDTVHRRIKLEAELREAIPGGQLFLEYQPLVDLHTGRASRFECLVRWEHPELGRISPEDFIPLAESSGLIVPLGEWVLREACVVNKRIQESGLHPVKAAVNVSAIQLRTEGFTATVASVLKETGLSAEFLELELTESTLIHDTASAAKALDELCVLGVTLSIDDFGTGYSSLSYLRQLSVDSMKIDRSFVMDVEEDSGAAAIVKASIGLAKNLGLRSVAEGVETTGQLSFLIQNGCDEVQGFYFNEPLSEELLRAGLHQVFPIDRNSTKG